jgi:hypothetical protein
MLKLINYKLSHLLMIIIESINLKPITKNYFFLDSIALLDKEYISNAGHRNCIF